MSTRKPVSTATVRAWGREHMDLIPEAGQKCLNPDARGRLHSTVRAAFLKANKSKTYVERTAEAPTMTVRVPFVDAKGRRNTKAVTVFEQMFTKAGGKVDGVAAANDGLGGAAISVLSKNGLAGKVPVTGQDATDEGLQRVLLGTQYVTVYKAVKKEAEAAAKLAIALAKGDTAAADALATGKVEDTTAKTQVPSVLLEPQAIFKDTVKDVIADGFTTKEKVCTTPELQKACTENGIS